MMIKKRVAENKRMIGELGLARKVQVIFNCQPACLSCIKISRDNSLTVIKCPFRLEVKCS